MTIFLKKWSFLGHFRKIRILTRPVCTTLMFMAKTSSRDQPLLGVTNNFWIVDFCSGAKSGKKFFFKNFSISLMKMAIFSVFWTQVSTQMMFFGSLVCRKYNSPSYIFCFKPIQKIFFVCCRET